MSLLSSSFVTDDEEDAGFKLAKPGLYTCQIKDTEMKVTNDGEGEYLKAGVEIMDGDSIGTMIFHNFNMVNKSDVAVRIGRGQLKKLCQIFGLSELTDTTELHGQLFQAEVVIQKGKGGYEDSNQIKKFHEASGNVGTSDGDDSSDPFDD